MPGPRINATPLCGVLLTLLVPFLAIAAPAPQALEVWVPWHGTGCGGHDFDRGECDARTGNPFLCGQPPEPAYVRFDPDTSWGDVITTIDQLAMEPRKPVVLLGVRQ